MSMLKERSISARQHGVRVHDYQMGVVIGRGTFAQIWSAFHCSSGREVAIKVLSKQKLAESGHGKIIIFNETILSRILSHPAIMDVYEVADSAGQYFQIMRQSEYGDLLRVLRSKALQKPKAVIDQILSAVEYLHSYGICHRDIKLDNIMMTDHGAKLGDFTIATMTSDGMMHDNCGSYEYSAPEAIRSPTYNGFKADIWSVGVVAYAIFTRRLPFTNVKEDFKYEKVEIDWTHVPEEMQPMIKSMLSINPDERPSAAECRASRVFGEREINFKKPMELLNEPIEINKDFQVISRLSQVMRVPIKRLRERLLQGTVNREKVLFKLMQKRMGSSAIFQSPPNQHSAPVGRPGTADRFIRTEDMNIEAASVWDAMHMYLLKQRFSISTPISGTLIAVQFKTPDQVLRFSFSVADKEEGGSTVTLVPNAQSVEFVDSLMAYLKQTLETNEAE